MYISLIFIILNINININIILKYLTNNHFQSLFSQAAASLISRLLIRDPALRLGAGLGDAEEIKAHPFFEGLDWGALERKEIPPPWKPVLANEIDTSYFNKKYTHADIDEATPPVCRAIQIST